MIVMFDYTLYMKEIKKLIHDAEKYLFKKGIEITHLTTKQCVKINIFKGIVDTKKRLENISADEAVMKVIEDYGVDGIYNLIFNNIIK